MSTATLDYFHGRTIESVEDIESGGFAIHLEGGGIIRSYDGNLGSPGADAVGWSLNNTSLSGADTIIYFGPRDNPMATVIHLNPNEYSVQDDNYTGGQEVFPQRGGLIAVPETPVANPATGAVSDGPDEEHLAAEAERAEAEEQRLAAAAEDDDAKGKG